MKLCKRATAVLMFSVSGGVSAICAQSLTQLGSASQLSTKDTTLKITAPVGTVYSGPSVSFVTGDRLTFSRGSGAYEVDQAGFNYGDTAFSNGVTLLGAGGFQGAGDGGPVTLTFTTPVEQFGLNIEEFVQTDYTVDFTAYNASGVDLGSFSAGGSEPGAGAGSLSFEGLTANQELISYISFDDSAAGGSNDLMFGNVEYAPEGTALQAPPAVTPEPSSIALLGTGLLALAAFTRRMAPRRDA